MKLHYYAGVDGRRNFGDELNHWLWSRLLPGAIDEDPAVLFVGIGTLLNDSLPPSPRTVVFGAGVGYGSVVPKPDESWAIYCVRGPLSARALGIAPEFAVTDPAALVARLLQPRNPGKWLTYMPHYGSACPALERIVRSAGLHYADPTWPVDRVLGVILKTRTLVTEALHGAICADALRIPWIPVHTGGTVLAFKWQDWCQSMGLEYAPRAIPRPWRISSLPTALLDPVRWSRGQLVARRLRRLARDAPALLSSERVLEQRIAALEERLEALRNDIRTGRFVARSAPAAARHELR